MPVDRLSDAVRLPRDHAVLRQTLAGLLPVVETLAARCTYWESEDERKAVADLPKMIRAVLRNTK